MYQHMLKSHFWECVVNKTLWITSPQKVLFKFCYVFFKYFHWRVWSKQSQGFAFYKAFLHSRWVTWCEERVLECFRCFEVCPRIKNWLLVESLALVYCGAWGPDYMVNFSPGWNFAPPIGLKYCCDYMLNFSPGAKLKFPWESLLRCENTIDTHACAPFSATAEKIIVFT